MEIKKNDFIEIEFTARVKDGEVFDTNIKEDAEKAGLKIEAKPFVLCVGHDMIIPGFDESLNGKQVGEKYSEEFGPEKAFGKRNASLIRMIPTKAFLEQKIRPERGMQLALDGRLVKVVSVSSGRTLVDFNNPLAGKVVVYDFNVNKKLEDINEKVNALQDFFFRKRFDFDVSDKVIFKVEEKMKPLVEMLGKNFEEMLGKKVEVEVVEEKPKEKIEKKEEKADKEDKE